MNSICIATYNGEKYIREQLLSILGQITPIDEVIISDDGSTDATLKVIADINDSRIKVYKAGYRNFKKNFENALNHASGEYIFLSDQDDIWLPNKYTRCLELLNSYDLVVTDSIVVNEELKEIIPSFFRYYKSGKGVLKNIFNNTYFGACMAFKRKILVNALPLPLTKEIGHDVWLGLVAEMIGSVYFLEEPYLLYRRHSNALTNISTNLSNRSNRKLYIKLMSRFIVFYKVFHFYIKNHD
ncbi:MAG: glycosyltransferase family 2 protein [Paludibacter sp.]